MCAYVLVLLYVFIYSERDRAAELDWQLLQCWHESLCASTQQSWWPGPEHVIAVEGSQCCLTYTKEKITLHIDCVFILLLNYKCFFQQLLKV